MLKPRASNDVVLKLQDHIKDGCQTQLKSLPEHNVPLLEFSDSNMTRTTHGKERCLSEKSR